ncbi:MAG: carboxypeptidase regulatory-like domain-containing protein [Thermoplasmata archaeon]|nr:carboxypeptidase regulatory-like domain-containing protein [Thermoplasmata archaeon]
MSFVMLVSAFAMVMTGENAEASVGGNDGWGYYYVDNQVPNPMITYNWIDISGSPNVILPHPDDDVFGPFRIGFPFVFYGNVFGEFCIGNNDGITFNTQPTCENIWAGNSPIPTAGEPDNLIAPFWDDLFEQGEIYYEVRGSAPYRMLIVEWYRIDHISNPFTEDLTFELILYETTNVIRFQYFDTLYGDPAVDSGMSAVAGIENGDGTIGVEYSYYTPMLFDGVAVEFHPVRQTHYFDDVDTPGSGWTTDGMWHVALEGVCPCYGVVGPPPTHPATAFSSPGAFAYHDDVTCTYDTPPLPNVGNLTSPPIDLTSAVTARLTFHSWWDSEMGGFYDRKQVQVSTDNVTFNTIYNVDNPEFPSQTWNLVAVNLNRYVGNVIWIRFQFETVDEVDNDMAGWYVDDINIDELIAPWPTNVALFKNMDPWASADNENAMNYWGIPYTVYGEADIGAVMLDPYDKVIISSDQDDPFYVAVEGNIPWFEFYVATGGVLQINAADSGWNSGSWPTGNLPGGYVYTNDNDNTVGVLEPTHTIMNVPNVITLAELQGWGSSVHGVLSTTPPTSTTILDESLGQPVLSVLVNAPYSGYIVSGQTLEFGYMNGFSPILENIILYMPFPPVPAADPPLLFNEWLNPWFGNETTGFNYTVWYSDINNDPPMAGHPLVHILDSLAMDIPGSPFTMSFDYWLGAPGDFVTGAAYYYNTTLPCPESYQFYMETLDSTGLSYVGFVWGAPDVICGNLPELSWTREPFFVADGLNPDWGDAATVFEWRVEYTDLDNEPPEAGHPILTIFENLMPMPGGPFTMNEVDPFDIDYTDGKLYTYSQTLTCGNDYRYRFDANDTAGNTAMLESDGPQVFCNDAPSLLWTGELNYVFDGLDPENGNTTTTFTYRIDFYDNDQHLPASGEPAVHILDSSVEILGSPFSMIEDDPIIWYLQEDFESGSPGWTGTGLWHEVDDSTDPCSLPSLEGTHSWGYHGDSAPPVLPGDECTFNVDDGFGFPAWNWGNLTSPFFDLTTATTATLSLWTWFDTEWGPFFDQKWIRISPDGVTWTDLMQLESGVDPSEEWFRVEIDLTAFIPGTYQIGFFFDTGDDVANAMRGWFVDDVWVYEGDANTTDGKRYTFDTTLACGVDLSYYFSGMDEKGLDAAPTLEIFAPTVACGPELDWTGEPNFVSDGLDPQVGDSLTNFEYRIQYSDRNNDAPAAGYPRVHILELGADIIGSPFIMNPLSWVGAGGDYVAGRTYTYSTTLPVGSDYSYYFYAEDGGALTNQTATLSGPLVTVPGDAPVLDWTGEANFVSDGLDPEMGDTTVTFEYRIQYSDADNDAPGAGHPVVHVLDGGFDIVGSPFTMSFDSWVGAVDDYTAGAIYTHSTMLPVGADYSYYFYADDIVGRFNLTITLLGPVVTPVGNDPPEAGDLTVDGYSPGSVGILHITNAFPTFAWSYSDPEAQVQTDYELRVGSAPGLNDLWSPGPAGVLGLTEVYGGGPLVPGMDYYFGVRVMDDAQWSPWNETLFHMNAVPPAPTTPVDPLDASLVDAGTGMTVSWTPGGADLEGDIVTYYWEVSTDMGFAWINESGSTTGTTSTGFDTIPLTMYYWRVNATDWYGYSAYGNTPPGYWTFSTTAVVDNTPEARFPGVGGFLDGTGGILHVVSATPTLNWTYNDTEGSPQAEYEVKVGTQSGLGDMWSPGAVAQPNESVAYSGTPLVDGTDYYFAVRVNDGRWGAWSEVMFHMNTPPPVPTLDLPDNGTADITPGSVDLDWSPVTDAEGDTITYYWYLSEQSDFTPLEDSGSTGSTDTTVDTQPDTKYYWKVEAYDGYEFGGSSTVFEFTTAPDVGSITGTVRDDATSEFIANAIVELLDSNDDVVDTDTTNLDGEFAFADVDFGTYSVRVTKSGYNDHLEEDVIISSGHLTRNLDIRLTEKVAEEFDWTLIWILLIVIIIIIAVLLILLMKRRKKPEEAPPAEQPIAAYPDQPPQQVPPQQPQPDVPPEQPPPAEPQPVEPRPPEPPAESE